MRPSDAARAIEENLFALPAFHPWPGAEARYDGPDLLWSVTRIRHPLFNSVARARLEGASASKAIDEAISRCAARKVPMLWWTGPSTEPLDLGERLVARGFVHASENPGMLLDLDRAPSIAEVEGLQIVPVTDLEALRVWNAVAGGIDARFEVYAWTRRQRPASFRHYIAHLNGEPAGTATLVLAAGVAGIYNVFTPPHVRKRGIGAALTAVALREARSLGYGTAVLQASAMATSLYRRLGFVEVCSIGHYTWSE